MRKIIPISGLFSSELDLRGNLSYRRSGNPPPPLFNIHTNRLTTTVRSEMTINLHIHPTHFNLNFQQTTSMTLPRNYHSSEFSSDEAASIDDVAHIGGDSMGRHSDEEEQVGRRMHINFRYRRRKCLVFLF